MGDDTPGQGPPVTSDSGRWTRGLVFVPEQGPCASHWVEVVNPQVMGPFPVHPYDEDGKPNLAVTTIEEIPLVMVRCRDCKLSWRFPEAMPTEGPGVPMKVVFDGQEPE